MSRLAPLSYEAVRTAFVWERTTQRYRLARTGRFVKRTAVKRALLKVVDGAKGELRELAARMAEGEVTIGEWQVRTARVVKSLHLAAHAAARGGFGQLTAADYGRVGAVLRFQYSRLAAFAVDAEQGRMTGPQIIARAGLYGASGNGTFEGGRRWGAEVAGKTQERRILHPAEHCAPCVEEALKGWQPIGTLLAIGEGTPCRSNCRCTFQFK